MYLNLNNGIYYSCSKHVFEFCLILSVHVLYGFRRTIAKSSSSPNVDEPVQCVENVAANEDAYEMIDPPPSQDAYEMIDSPPSQDAYEMIDSPPSQDAYEMIDSPPSQDAYEMIDSPPSQDAYEMIDPPPSQDAYEMIDPPPSQEAKPYTVLHVA